MVLAMGAVNNAFQRGGEIAVGLTYMTGAPVRLGQGIGAALMGERRTASHSISCSGPGFSAAPWRARYCSRGSARSRCGSLAARAPA
jgi:hypothetical protein